MTLRALLGQLDYLDLFDLLRQDDLGLDLEEVVLSQGIFDHGFYKDRDTISRLAGFGFLKHLLLLFHSVWQ